MIDAVKVGADQRYKVPAGTIPFIPSVGVITNGVPLHVTTVIALMSAIGRNVTISVNGALDIQLGVDGVTV